MPMSMTTKVINGHYAASDWAGGWHILNSETNDYTGESFSAREDAIAHLRTRVAYTGRATAYLKLTSLRYSPRQASALLEQAMTRGSAETTRGHWITTDADGTRYRVQELATGHNL